MSSSLFFLAKVEAFRSACLWFICPFRPTRLVSNESRTCEPERLTRRGRCIIFSSPRGGGGGGGGVANSCVRSARGLPHNSCRRLPWHTQETWPPRLPPPPPPHTSSIEQTSGAQASLEGTRQKTSSLSLRNKAETRRTVAAAAAHTKPQQVTRNTRNTNNTLQIY